MIYRHIAGVEVATYFACSTSWITQSEPAKPNNTYFNAFIVDSMSGLQRRETVYVFTEEQMTAILIRCGAKGWRTSVKEIEGCYRIERVLK